MKIAIVPVDQQHCFELLADPIIAQIVLHFEGFNLRDDWTVNTDSLELIVKKNQHQKDLCVSFSSFVHQEQLLLLKQALITCQKLQIPTICFRDYAVASLLDEIDYRPRKIYDSPTLSTNFGQTSLFIDNQIDQVVLSRELNINELLEIIKKPHRPLQYQVYLEGHQLMMYSRWQLMKNYQDHYHIKEFDAQKCRFQLCEQQRKYPVDIVQTKSGLAMYTDYNISSFLFLDQLIACQLEFGRIDCYLHSKKWADNILAIYTRALQEIKNKEFATVKQQLWKQIEALTVQKPTCGFLQPWEGLKNLKLGK